jgi:hypothetical protein
MILLKWIVICVVFWILLITGLVVYAQIYKNKTIDISQGETIPITSLDKYVGDGPLVGDQILGEESPKQVIIRYLNYINAGNYDVAAGLIDANVIMDYTSKHKEMSVKNAMIKYLSVFQPLEGVNVNLNQLDLHGGYAEILAKIKLANQKVITVRFLLQENRESTHGTGEIYWIIYDQQLEK